MPKMGSIATKNGSNLADDPTVGAITPAQFNGIPEVASYPTGSLDFLAELNEHPAHDELCPRLRLDIIIVGAGLGGLAAAVTLALRGHLVTVFEQAPALAEVGAGIQIPSNSARLLIKWGLAPLLKEQVVEPEDIKIRRWEDGSVIGLTQLVPNFRENFDAPYYVVHRAHFHTALYERALALGVKVRINSQVQKFDVHTPSITLLDGSIYTSDLIVAADGIQSAARALVLDGADLKPHETGFAAYRATVDVEKMRKDPDTSWLLDKPSLNLWIGDLRHVMSYTIAGGKSFNMVLSHPDYSDPATWKRHLALQTMKEEFQGWDPRLTKVIGMIDSTTKWPLLSGAKLERWVHPGKKLIIMGDAAHAMVPYMSQGAAMAVEDAAALGQVLDFATDMSNIGEALELWEVVRIERTSQMQQASLINGKLWHFADGPEQRARDKSMRSEVDQVPFISSANQWSDPTTQRWCYAYDAEKEIRLAWHRRQSTSVDVSS